MDRTMTQNGKLRFGPFDFDPSAGELRKHGIRIRLQTKPLAMLRALVERPGEVIPREQLRQKLWPEEPYVDFEAGLNTAAKRLRDALSDSAGEPRYIETIPRTGYRFIAAVEHAVAAPPRRESRPADNKRSNYWLAAAATALLCLLGMIAWLATRKPAEPPRFRQVNFRKGQVLSARFAPGGETILYTLQEGASRRVYLSQLFSPESRSVPGAEGTLVSVSKRGEMALLRYDGLTPLGGGTLWRMPVNGGGAIEADRNIFAADWDPEGAQLAVARAVDGSVRLEYPPGNVLFKTSGYLSSIRFRPGGEEIAFIHHPVRHDDAGSLEITDRQGRVRTVTRDWAALSSIAWHPGGGSLWFSASRKSELRTIWTVPAAGGTPGKVLPGPGNVSVSDISPDGRALIGRAGSRLEMAIGGLDAPTEDISWLDWSSVKDVSRGGELVLFEENGDGVDGNSVVFVHKRRERSTIRIGAGMAMALNPDATEALVLDDAGRTRLRMVPIGPGKPRDLPRSGLTYQWARFYPGGKALIALASRGQEPLRLHKVSVDDGSAVPIAPPAMVRNTAVSPDGSTAAALTADGTLRLYPAGTAVRSAGPLAPILWTREGLVVHHTPSYTSIPGTLSILDPKTGKLRFLATLDPGDRFGVNAITRVVLSPDARHWAFSYRRSQGDLFLADGIE